MGATLIRCRHCGEVIGVYEPLIAVERGSARESSLAREPALAYEPVARYHRDCHEYSFPRASVDSGLGP